MMMIRIYPFLQLFNLLGYNSSQYIQPSISIGTTHTTHPWIQSTTYGKYWKGREIPEGSKKQNLNLLNTSNPFQCSCLENPRDGEAWWAAVSGVAQSRTRLKRLSSSGSSRLFLSYHFSKINCSASYKFIEVWLHMALWGSFAA